MFKGVHMTFLKGLLEPSPSKRLTAKQALMHEYFEELRENDPEFMASENASTTQRTLEIQRKPSSKYSNKNKFSVYDVKNNKLKFEKKSIEISRRNKIQNEEEKNRESHSRTQNWSSSRSKKLHAEAAKENDIQTRKPTLKKLSYQLILKVTTDLGKNMVQ